MKEVFRRYCVEQLESILAIPSPTGYTMDVATHLMGELAALGYAPQRTAKGCVLVDLGGQDQADALVLSCHVDTLGGMVRSVKENGRLRITPLGGLNPDNTEAENVCIHTRSGRTFSGTLQLDNASVHVNLAYKDTRRSFDNMEVVIDEKTASPEETAALGIEVGDIVSFDPRTRITPAGYIKSRFLDDKLSSAILLAYARRLKEEGLVPRRRIYLFFTVYEEVGHGAAAGLPDGVTEMLAVDMGCVGEGLQCDETMVSICAKDSQGPASYEVVSALVRAAKDNGIRYAVDVYPAYGSDADAATRAGYDIRHCVLGPGVYASHGYERSHLEGVENTFDLLCAYVETL